ncbi:MAG: hypothetical protein LBC17_00925 [Lactobacillaceae bacterium]|jgi:hypothetical protein|nr:hypothetical protein [Lactobacillaceae bacterium]
MDGVDAKARLSKDESLELLSGSEIKKNVRRHQAEEKILNELINDELVEDLGEKYKLKEDLEFQSISGATKLICGGSQNG